MVTCSVFLLFFLLKGLVDGVIITFSQLELFYWKCIYRRGILSKELSFI